MEGLAIAILIMILILGGVIFFIFLQFLGLVRENNAHYQKITGDLAALSKKIDDLAQPAGAEAKSDPVKA